MSDIYENTIRLLTNDNDHLRRLVEHTVAENRRLTKLVRELTARAADANVTFVELKQLFELLGGHHEGD